MNDETRLAWHRVASTSEVTEDEPRAVQVEGHPIALYKIDGAIYATHDICTHEFASLSEGFVEGNVIECPLPAYPQPSRNQVHYVATCQGLG